MKPADVARMDSLIHHACEGGLSYFEILELEDLVRDLKGSVKANRARVLAADRRRTIALVRAFLAPPGAELTVEAEQLLADIRNGARP